MYDARAHVLIDVLRSRECLAANVNAVMADVVDSSVRSGILECQEEADTGGAGRALFVEGWGGCLQRVREEIGTEQPMILCSSQLVCVLTHLS